MIDLHLHTTASDGLLTPRALIARACAAGLTTISVTDHDTVVAHAEVSTHAAAAGITLVAGIEVTAVDDARDVHVLGYFIDPDDAPFLRFLEDQREARAQRVRDIGRRLEALGVPIDVDRLLATASAHPGVSVGRPALAQALVEAGHVASLQEAFDRFLAVGAPAYVPRTGRSPREVVDAIHAAGGVASLAHPGVTRRPELIEPLVAGGLDAIEAYHSDHSPAVEAECLELAARLQICVTGGSDYHGDDVRRPLGGVVLPADAFQQLSNRAAHHRRRRQATRNG